jgi:hypothetical protein
MQIMRNRLFFAMVLALSIAGCGGNVSVAAGGAGGTGGTGNSGGNTGTSTTATTVTTTPVNDFTACNAPGQCVLAAAGCCGPCGTPELDAYVAINGVNEPAFHKSVCPEEPPCVPCETTPNPNLFAYCDAGHCVAADIRTHAVSLCKTAADCRLRWGADCCEGCGLASLSDLTSVASTEMPTLETLVCAPEVGCPKCAAQYPSDANPVCGSDGHCEIVFSSGAP